jgi:hypothetical protein
MKRVLGIDAGYKNFAYCELQEGIRRPFTWKNVSLFEGSYDEEKLFAGTMQWCLDNADLLKAVDRIVLERQMKMKFAVINTVIRSLYYKKTIVVNPLTVGKHYGLPRTRAEKKKAAVNYVSKLTAFNASATRKKDDLADSYLLAHYGFSIPFLTQEGQDVRHAEFGRLCDELSESSEDIWIEHPVVATNAAESSTSATKHFIKQQYDIDLSSSGDVGEFE